MNAADAISTIWKQDTTQPAPYYFPYISRIDLALMFNALGFERGAEIGVSRGDYAYSLCKHNPQAQIYLIDPYRVYIGYGDVTSHAQMKQNQNYAEKRLGCYTNANFIHETSAEALQRFADNSLDFVYIDANHELPYVAHDIYHWTRKVKPGGIVSGHDYTNNRTPRCHVRQALTAYIDAAGIEQWYLIGAPERVQTWLFVKPNNGEI